MTLCTEPMWAGPPRPRRPVAASLGILLGGLLSTACGPTMTEQPQLADEPAPAQRTAMVVETERGGLNHESVQRTFLSLERNVQDCVAEGMERIDGLAGRCKVALRIGTAGDVRWAYMSESTLGDRLTEKCILDAARSRTWPQPLGGEGEAEHEFAVDGTQSVRQWDAERVRPIMRYIRRKVWRCVRRGQGRFVATLYVRRDGQVLSVGVAPPSAEAEERSDCVSDALRKFNFGRQRSRLSKVTIEVP